MGHTYVDTRDINEGTKKMTRRKAADVTSIRIELFRWTRSRT